MHDELSAQALQQQHAALEAAGSERRFAAEAPGWADAAATLAAAATHARGVIDALQRMAQSAAGGPEAAGAEPQEGRTAGGAAGAPGGAQGLAGAAGSAQGAPLGGSGAGGSAEEDATRWAEDAERAVEALLLWAQALPQAPDSARPLAAHHFLAHSCMIQATLLGAAFDGAIHLQIMMMMTCECMMMMMIGQVIAVKMSSVWQPH